MLGTRCLCRCQPSTANIRFNHISPCFTTEPKENPYKMLSYTGAVSCILNGKPNFPFPPQYAVQFNDFLTGSRKAIESISKHISTRNFPALSNLINPSCMDSLRVNVFEKLSPEEINKIRVNSEDIFFQYIESAEVMEGTIRISLVSMSLPRLAECIKVKNRMENFQQNLFNKASRTDGILRKEDLNASQFRKIRVEFEELNLGKLAKDYNILVTTYRFERCIDKGEDFSVTAVSHTDTTKIWSYVRQLIWKGRVHTAVHFEMDFYRLLRYDYILDIVMVLIAIYLQMLAVIIGYKFEEEAERRRKLAEGEL